MGDRTNPPIIDSAGEDASGEVGTRRLAIFTIATSSFLPSARILMRSARKHHPEAELHIVMVDGQRGGVPTLDDDCNIIGADRLAIANFESLAFRYGAAELSVALKPHGFLHLLDAGGYDDVFYFDADIEIHRPLVGVRHHLRTGSSLVLTPHVTEPLEEEGEPNDISFMRAGIYNAGFLAVARCDEATEILRWWARRLHHDCVSAQADGIFLDQKFMDLVPAFARQAHISHDKTLNVAYWNLPQRVFGGRPGCWTVDGKPITFFHFSGFDPATPSKLSRYTRRYDNDLCPELDAFVRSYAARLQAEQRADPLHPWYRFERFASGAVIHPFVRNFFRAMRRDWPSDPFTSLEAFLDEPAEGVPRHDPEILITKLMKVVFDQVPSLNRRLDLARREHAWELVHWFVFHAERDIGLDQRLVVPALERMEKAGGATAWPSVREVGGEHVDAAVFGWLARSDDSGEAARGMLRLLGPRGEGVDLGTMPGHEDAPVAGPPRMRIIHVDPENGSPAAPRFDCAPSAPILQVAVPFWGFNRIAQPWLAACDGMDEIWAPSRFTQRAFMQQVSDRPVLHVPPPLRVDLCGNRGRSELGLPAEGFLVFCAFEAASLERTNPRAALAAFRLFRRHAGSRRSVLVLHAIGRRDNQAALAELDREIAEEPGAVMLRDDLPRGDVRSFMAAADCILCLHRSEGSALLVAEAMVLGTCVIATGYAATAELITEATGFPVNRRVVPADPADCPFGEDQLWADPDIEHAAWYLRRLAEQAEAGAVEGIRRRARDAALRRHDPGRVAELLRQRLDGR